MLAEFECPTCQARYKVVRVTSGPQITGQSIHCKVCKRPLASTDDGKILKYFLVYRPKTKRDP
jgi:transcription elongation factor Elf1